ncbi:hypothetical protein Tco_0525932 [Tanacetum coccineum]
MKGVNDVLEKGPWMIINLPIILNKWKPSFECYIHEGNPLMLDSYTCTMCNESWGMSSYGRAMVGIQSDKDLKESIVIAIPNLKDDGYTYEKGDLNKLACSDHGSVQLLLISPDSSDDIVGSPPLRDFLLLLLLLSSAAAVVEMTLVGFHTGLCGLCSYSIPILIPPDEMSSPEHISLLPTISPFLCTDSSEAPDSSDGPSSQDPYVMVVAHWRSKVALRPSSSSEFPIALVTALPGIRRQSAILIRPGEVIPFGRPYRTHLNGPHSSLVHSSGLDAPDQAHSKSLTRDVPPRLCYPLRRAPQHRDSSERPLHSSSHFAGSSRKRCRYPVDSVPSSRPVMGSLTPTRVDLLPPRKRFRDSYSSEASIEEDTEVDPIKTEVDIELGIGDGDDVRDHVEIDTRDVRNDTKEYEANTSAGDTVEVGIDPMSAPIVEVEIVKPTREDSSDSSSTRDGIVRSFKDIPIDLDDVVHDFYHHMSEVLIDRIVRIETDQRRLEANQLIAKGERAGMIERIESLRLENLKEEFRQVRRDRDDTRGRLRRTMTNTRSGVTPAAIEEMINQRVDAALEARQVNRDLGLRNGNDNEGGDGNGNDTGNGNNGGDNGDGNENHNGNGRGDRPGAHECTYQDFMKCQPLSFKGTEGVVGLIRWSEKMETVFHISNCPEKYQVKYATCTLLDSALTWWNSHKRTIGTNAAYALSWRELLKLMTEVNNDMATYTQRFQELTMMCTKMVPEEEDWVEKFIGGLPDNIQGNVIAA